MNLKFIDELTQRLASALPQGVRDLQGDLKNNIRMVLQSTFEKMDLVTREDYEVQAKVLARTREKLDALEKQVAALEAELSKPAKPSKASKPSKPAK